MRDIDLSQLSALAAVVDEGSFEAAARKLHITPSAVSQRVKSFEKFAGAVLVQRTKPARITEAGIPFLRLAQQIRSLVADVETVDGEGESTTIPIAVNGDSLNAWVLPALASLSDTMCFDIHREDQDHSAELLRQGVVMAAVTASGEPVQGCSVTKLGVMRYRPMCTPAFRDRWFDGGPSPRSFLEAPVVAFDRSDDLQDRYASRWGGASRGRRHYVPSSPDFAEAVRLGLGWAVLPRQQSDIWEKAGEIVDFAPGTFVDVTLFWQAWSVRTRSMQQLSAAILAAAASNLD